MNIQLEVKCNFEDQYNKINDWCEYWFSDSNFRITDIWIKKVVGRLPKVVVYVSELIGCQERVHRFECSHLLRDKYDFEDHKTYVPNDLVYGPDYFIGYVD